jgi:putative transposase
MHRRKVVWEVITKGTPDSLGSDELEAIVGVLHRLSRGGLLLRNRYLATENRSLRRQIQARLRLTEVERLGLVELAKRIGRKALEEVAQIVGPEPLLAWQRRLIAKKFDGSKHRASARPAPQEEKVGDLVLTLASQNWNWGYRRIAGALGNLGYKGSHQTAVNLLQCYGIAPAPERGNRLRRREFIRANLGVLAAVDFLTVGGCERLLA